MKELKPADLEEIKERAQREIVFESFLIVLTNNQNKEQKAFKAEFRDLANLEGIVKANSVEMNIYQFQIIGGSK